MNSKRQKRAIELIHAIKYQYPRLAATFSQCTTAECTNMARGRGKCAKCLLSELSDVLKNPFIAQGFLHAVETVSKIESELIEIAYDMDNKEDNGQ